MFHTTDGRRIHSLSFGSGSGTLVGVAGALASWEIWAPVFERLSTRWRVVGFDHDGVGQTKVPIDTIAHDRHVDTLLSVLDAQSIDRCVIAGDSANAAVAIEASLRAPERIQGLIVANGHVWGFDRPEVRRFVEALRSDFEPTVEFFVNLVFPEPDSDHLKLWLRDIIRRTGAESAARLLEANFSVDLRPRLAEVRVPVLIVHGALDAVSSTALDDAHELARLLPDARLELVDDAGHLPLLSRPQLVADLIERFLLETTSASSQP